MRNIELNYTAIKDETISEFMLSKGFSSNNIFHEIFESNVLIDGKIALDKNALVNKNSKIKIVLNSEQNDLMLNSEKIDILYEDDYLLIVNKSPHVLVEPYKIGTNNNLASMVANYFFVQGIPSKVHLVNRLDKCTSGIVVIAKNRYIKNLLANQRFNKKYYAVVEGKVNEEGTINICVDKEPHCNSRIISNKGKKSFTKYELVSYDNETDSSLVDVEIFTGRTHQIRLSFASIGHPLLGDEVYGSKRKADIYLQAYYLKFTHSILNKDIEIKLKAR